MAAALVPAAFSADYSVFRVCQDQRVIHTSDGAEAGRIEYLVTEPGSQRIVSTIVTGGVVGDQLVAVPFSALQFGADRQITLTEITRDRLVSAPLIERSQLESAQGIQPAVFQKTEQYFGVRSNSAAGNTNVTAPEVDTSTPAKSSVYQDPRHGTKKYGSASSNGPRNRARQNAAEIRAQRSREANNTTALPQENASSSNRNESSSPAGLSRPSGESHSGTLPNQTEPPKTNREPNATPASSPGTNSPTTRGNASQPSPVESPRSTPRPSSSNQ